MTDASNAEWPADIVPKVVSALGSCSSMDDPQFRVMFVSELKDNLRTKSFGVTFQGDARLHIRTIVRACKEHKNPAEALHALYLTTLDLLPGTGAAKTLEDCDRRVNGWGTLSPSRLRSVIDLIASLNSHPGAMKIRELAATIKYEGEILPSDSLDERAGLMEIVGRLNEARVTGHGAIPPVVRFIAALISKLHGDDALRVMAELGEITAELKLTLADVIAVTDNLLSRPDRRILQIRLSDEGPPGQPCYKIDGKLLQVIAGVRRNPVTLPPSQDDDVDEAWRQFLRKTRDLGRQIGSGSHVTVEFILPWPLLGYPVERWNIDQASGDDDGYCIGHRFPVVVRSLERRADEIFLGPWQYRWNMLFGTSSTRRLCDRMAWLHHKESDLPRRAQDEKRGIRFQGHGCLTSWLTEHENLNIVSLGLTYAYHSEDKLGRLGLREAFQEGIPILIWRRDGGDPNELEDLLANIDIDELTDKVLTWRRQAAGPGSGKVGAQIVVMWDDPTDVSPAFSAPLQEATDT